MRARRVSVAVVLLPGILLLACAAQAPPPGRPSMAGRFTFEEPGRFGTPEGWGGGPASTFAIDSAVVHSGRRAGRLARDADSEGPFSAMTLALPVDFAGKSLELRGWLKFENVRGFVGLWQRQDGPGGSVQFDNMQSRGLSGTKDWTEVRVSLPLDERARSVSFGALLAGTGRLWVDDLELLVDGRPFSEAPAMVRPQTAVDTDHEFDAGSRIAAAPLTPAQVGNLVTLGKVWGFVKYRHPRVTGAQVHWDYELFRVLPAVLAAKDRAGANAAIEAWLAKLGDPPPCEPCAQEPATPHLRPRLEWIADRARLGDALAARLATIHARRDADGEQHYVLRRPMGAGNAEFRSEQLYPDAGEDDAGHRLLAVYRFWNIVESFFPYRDVMEEDWDAVLAEFIPRAFAAPTKPAYALVLMELVARVHDGHANLWSSTELRPPVGECSAPVPLRFLDGQFVVGELPDSVAHDPAGLLPGDAILAVDGVPADSLAARARRYYGASNEAAAARDFARVLLQGECGPGRILRDRAGARAEIPLERGKLEGLPPGLTHDRPGPAFRRVSEDLAYLKLSSVRAAETGDYVRQSQGARLLVIDVRNYPSEFVVFALGQHLVPGKTGFVAFTAPDLANPGAFLWVPSPPVLEPREPRFTGRVALLVDETTQSSAEYTTMALRRAPGAIVVGSTTAGADGNASPIPLPGGLRAMISGLGVFTPERGPTQRVGILPDLVVRPTRAGLAAGRDEVLEAAVRSVLGRPPTAPELRALAL
jgi:hypothetical protein